MKAALLLSPQSVQEATACFSVLCELEKTGWETQLWLTGLPEYPLYPASGVLLLEGCYFESGISTTEWLLHGVEMLWEQHRPDLLLMPENLTCNEVCPRLAARKELAVLNGCSALMWQDVGLVAEKAVYGGNVTAQFTLPLPCTVTLRTEEFTPYSPPVPYDGTVEKVPFKDDDNGGLELVERISVGGADFVDAPLLLIAGRGIGGRATLVQLERVAELTSASLGCTRPVVQSGLMSSDRLVGITGASVHPKVAIVLGASGSSPFLSGLQKADTIVAVNNDPAAPIFRQADIGAVADCNAVIESLLALL